MVLSIFIYLVISVIKGELSTCDIKKIWGNVSTTITIVATICSLFISWAWKLRVFRGWLVPFPCLSGRWIGEIKAVYNGKQMTIPTEANINHTFFNIQIKIRTGESSSISTCGGFDIDKDRGLNNLIYTYQNTPKVAVREHSEIHFGTARVEINDDATRLDGEYWTSRKTIGDIVFTKRDKADREEVDLSKRSFRKRKALATSFLKDN